VAKGRIGRHGKAASAAHDLQLNTG
jgi:hypothetical protein